MTGIIEINDQKLIAIFKAVAEKAWEDKHSLRGDNQHEGRPALPHIKTKDLYEADILNKYHGINEYFRIARDKDGNTLILNTATTSNHRKVGSKPQEIPYVAYNPKVNTLKTANWGAEKLSPQDYIKRLAIAYGIS